MKTNTERVIFSNYFWENDIYGKDAYDYAREWVYGAYYDEHHFTEDDVEHFTDGDGNDCWLCPICGAMCDSLEDAMDCCSAELWEGPDDVPDELVTEAVYNQAEWDWDDFKVEMEDFLSRRGRFILVGSVGRWDGRRDGGSFVNSFDDLYAIWDGCHDIKVTDVNGHLYIKAGHHDGTNYAELLEVTKKGEEYARNHCCDYDCEVIEHLANISCYTKFPRYDV